MIKYNIFKLIGLVLSISPAFGQVCQSLHTHTIVHGNEIRAAIANEGCLFWDGGTRALFQVPYNNANSPSSLFAGAIWLGAYDSGGDLKLAAQTYRQSGSDYFDGPLNAQGVVDTAYCPNFTRLWRVDAAAVEGLIQDYLANAGSITQVDSVLLVWPGRNNPHFQALMGFPLQPNRDFAPFYDHNGDGNYNPFHGDYPVFEQNDPRAIASSMVWTIFNDNGGIHTESNGNILNVEVHLTAYALYCPNDSILNRTLFTRHRIVGRNNPLLTNMLAALWFDTDLGCYSDDYLGTAPAQNASFFYNLDNDDDTLCGNNVWGYGAKPPVQSVMFLNQPLFKTMYYENSINPIRGNPSSAIQYQRLMNGQWIDGTTLSQGGNGYNGPNATPYDFVFDGAPIDSSISSWTMVNEGVLGADYRMLMSVKLDTLLPNGTHTIDAAYVYHRDTTLADNIQMTTLVGTELPMVQDWYDNGFPASCFPAQTLAVRKALNAQQEVLLFPNPNIGHFTLKLNNTAAFQLRVFNAAGQLCLQQTLEGAEQYELQMPETLNGLYFYQLNNAKGTVNSGTFVVQK